MVFRRAKPRAEDVIALVERIAGRAERYLARKGCPVDDDVPDAEDGLAPVQALSLGGVIAVGPRRACAVRRTRRLGGEASVLARVAQF